MTTKLIRGKIVVDSSRERRSEATALSSSGERAVGPAQTITETTELNPLRDGKTFANETAPWVGAEKAWRQSILPPPHEEWIEYPEYAGGHRADATAEEKTPLLTDDDLATVLSTLPPPADPEPPRRFAASQFFKYAAVAAFTAVTAWAVFGGRQEAQTAVREPLTVAAAVSDVPPAAAAIPKEEPFIESVAEAVPSETVATSTSQESAPPMIFEEDSLQIEEQSVASVAKQWVPRREKPVASVVQEEESSEDVSSNETVTLEERSKNASLAMNETQSPAAEEAVESVPTPTAAAADESESVVSPFEESDSVAALIDTALEPQTGFSKSNPYETETIFDKSTPYAAEKKAGATDATASSDGTVSSSRTAIPRAEIERVMSGIAPHVARCGGEERDRIVLEVWVSGATGRVTEAFVADKAHANTAVGICASKAVRLAKFPKFSGERLTVKYPFNL